MEGFAAMMNEKAVDWAAGIPILLRPMGWMGVKTDEQGKGTYPFHHSL